MTLDKVGPEPALVPVYLEADSPPPLPSLLPNSFLFPLILLSWVTLGCFYKDFHLCWLWEPQNQVTSRKIKSQGV